MKKLNLFYITVFLLIGTGMLYSQAAADRLYLTLANTGRIYDITALSTTPATAINLPNAVTTPGVPGGTNANASNLAVGYDQPGGNPSNIVFIQSNISGGSTLYKNGTVISGTTTPTGIEIGGIATNNVPGPFFGNVYGFQRNTKVLYPIYPAGTATTITGDTIWTEGATLGTDTFFDYQNNIYMFVNYPATNPTSRYLYKISIGGSTAQQVVQIAGTAASVSSIQGMAYLQGSVYIATVLASTIEVRRINIFNGSSSLVATYNGGAGQNLDLATVPYYVPFQFTCSGITQTSTTSFVKGVASNSQKFINIPINNVYADGAYTINIIGTDFNSSSNVNITSSTTSIQVPLNYTGGGNAGTRTLQVNLNGSTTACPINVIVEEDTDGDGIGNSQDLDSDNDGILDIFECADTVVSRDFSTTDGTVTTFDAPAADLGFIFDVYRLDNSFNLNINGVNISTSTLEFQPDQTDNVRFLDGSKYGDGTVPQIYSMTGNADNPLVRVIIHKNGSIAMYGSKSGGSALFPLQLYNGNAFNNIIWNQTGTNTVRLSQPVVGTTYISGKGQGFKFGFCDPDNDGISNQYDVDSDGDGCPDAIEGSEAVRFDQVHSMTLPTTDTNYRYRGQIKVAYNGTTTGTPAQIVSNSASAFGVSQLVNNAGNNLNTATNPSNLAGLVDNTDGTSDVGQGIGTALNASARDVECDRCFRPATTPGVGGLSTSQGFTSLQRAGGGAAEWPGKIKGAYTALDAKTKGFVINRVPTTSLSSIIGVAGMIVYDTTENCLKVYDGTAWSCFSKQTCDNFNQ